MVSNSTSDYVKLLASRSPNREVCGIIDSDEKVYPIINVSMIPTDFVLSRSGYGRTLNEIKSTGKTIKCIYHSHLDGDPLPSTNDLKALSQCGIDYLIVAGSKHTYTRYENE